MKNYINLKDKKMLATIAIALVIGLCVGYFAPHASSRGGQFSGGTISGQFSAADRSKRLGGGFTMGTILSYSNNILTLKQQNGSSTELVLVGPSTEILKTMTGSLSDLSAGKTVAVTGSTNADGSVSATSIQIRPTDMTYPNRAGRQMQQ